MTASVSIDFETRSTEDLKVCGVSKYAACPETDIWCFAYAFDDEEPALWWPNDPFPERLRAHIEACGELRAWNAAFERIIWRDIGVARHGFPPVADEQWVCTAAEAAAMSLPRSLDEAARVLGVAETKDSEGYGLMLRMSRPRRIEDDGTIVWWDVPERMQRLGEYCKQDVRTERAVGKCLHRLNARERRIYLLDQRINDRGVLLDRDLALAARDVAHEGIRRANATLTDLSAGAVTEVTQTGQLRAWLNENGVSTHSVAKPAVTQLLEGDLPGDVRRVLEVRAEAGRSSIAKIDRMLRVASDADDRLRDLALYHGATTGRWTGRLVQPHNFPRGEVKDVESYIEAVLARRFDDIDVLVNPVAVVSSMLRSMLRARPGYVLRAADFSAIECRVLNWLAGQDDVVASFREYDRTGDKRYDPYRRQAVAMGRGDDPLLVSAYDRQAGKAAELGCGYGMGWKKFITAAWDIYQVRVNEEEAQRAVRTYRDTHHKVVQLWYDANQAAINAVRESGSVQHFGPTGNLRFLKRKNYLYCILPSRRALVYPAPKLVERVTPWGEVREAVQFWAVDSYTKKWSPHVFYGGLIVENIVQAVSRDLLAEAMLRLEERGYPVVLHVHDEIVTEVPRDFGSTEEVESIMRELPAWAAGCPVNTEGWSGERYRK